MTNKKKNEIIKQYCKGIKCPVIADNFKVLEERVKAIIKDAEDNPSAGIINPKLGVTEGQLRGQIRGALRKCWRNSRRRVFVQSVRFPYEGIARFKYAVACEKCDRIMGQTEKEYGLKKDGKRTKNKKLAYEVDHITGNPALLELKRDLGAYAHSLLFGELRLLCRPCHTERTSIQTKKRNSKEKE